MQCPNCKEKFNATGANSVDCVNCNGSWLSGNIINELLINNGNNPTLEQLQSSVKEKHESKSSRLCAECPNQELHEFHLHGTEIDYCINCHGVFFDKDEIKKIFKNNTNEINTYKPKQIKGEVAYAASEGLFHILLGLFG